MTMSSRIAVMDAGRIVQVDTPTTIYEYPKSRFVAGFIGSANLFDGKVAAISGEEVRVETRLGRDLLVKTPHPVALGTPVGVAVRPEKLRATDDWREDGVNQLRGVVEDIAYLGDVSIYRVRVAAPDGGSQLVEMTLTNLVPRTEQALTWDQPVAMEWHTGSAVLLLD